MSTIFSKKWYGSLWSEPTTISLSAVKQYFEEQHYFIMNLTLPDTNVTGI